MQPESRLSQDEVREGQGAGPAQALGPREIAAFYSKCTRCGLPLEDSMQQGVYTDSTQNFFKALSQLSFYKTPTTFKILCYKITYLKVIIYIL